MLKGVLFDFDGVVVRSEELHKKTFMELLAPYGVKVGTERWYREFAGTGSRHIFEVLVKEHHIDADIDSFVGQRKLLYEARVRSGELKETPGVRDFISSLKENGISKAIVSGSHTTNIRAALETLAMESLFDTIVSGDDLKERKPDPAPFLAAASKLALRPADCVVIEDSVAGCESARRAGMKLVVMASPASPFVGRHDLEIKDFRGIDAGKMASLFSKQ